MSVRSIMPNFDENGIKLAFPTVQIAGEGRGGFHRRRGPPRPRADPAGRGGIGAASAEPRLMWDVARPSEQTAMEAYPALAAVE